MNGSTIEDKSLSWQQAVSVDIASILFMHCHQVKERENSIKSEFNLQSELRQMGQILENKVQQNKVLHLAKKKIL